MGEDKIKELQVKKWHTYENNNFGVVLSNVRKIWIRKIKCQPTTTNSIFIKNVVILGQFMSHLPML